MNIVKQLIIKPQIRKKYHTMIKQMIKNKGEEPDPEILKYMEESLVRTEIARLDINTYPLYKKLIDRINEIIDVWIDVQKNKIEYYKMRLHNNSKVSII